MSYSSSISRSGSGSGSGWFLSLHDTPKVAFHPDDVNMLLDVDVFTSILGIGFLFAGNICPTSRVLLHRCTGLPPVWIRRKFPWSRWEHLCKEHGEDLKRSGYGYERDKDHSGCLFSSFHLEECLDILRRRHASPLRDEKLCGGCRAFYFLLLRMERVLHSLSTSCHDPLPLLPSAPYHNAARYQNLDSTSQSQPSSPSHSVDPSSLIHSVDRQDESYIHSIESTGDQREFGWR